MNDFQLIYSEDALRDFDDIFNYIALTLQEKDTAAKLLERLRNEIRGLRQFPFAYALVEWEPWRSLGLRKLPVNHFIVYYIAEKDSSTVSVLRILYGARNTEQLFSEYK